jgi:LysM repeat protein
MPKAKNKKATKKLATNIVIVKSGDTLSGIAHQHHLTLKQLNKLNPKLAQHQLLKPGQSIKVKN